VAADGTGEGWAALGDPTRRAIVAALAERPRPVGELADALPVSRPAVSLALKVLKDAGLVTDRADGTRRIYRLNPTAVAALRDQLDTYWNRALAGYQDAVASPDASDPADAPGAGEGPTVTEARGQERP
jgi:DNA-binding transcriptional ArsR family regulator